MTRPGPKPIPVADRLFARVVVGLGESDCWEWQGCIGSDGYGRIGVGQRPNNRPVVVHRVSYQLLVGPIPEGLTLDHLCRNRACVNPAHLEPVTNAENVLRGMSGPARNARKTHCQMGHAFTPKNTYSRSATGYRACRTCALAKKWANIEVIRRRDREGATRRRHELAS